MSMMGTHIMYEIIAAQSPAHWAKLRMLAWPLLPVIVGKPYDTDNPELFRSPLRNSPSKQKVNR